MSKLRIIDKKSEKSINSEREFLSKLHNPFIVNMHYAFQDSENLYLVMDLMSGGDLRYHISRHKKFSEEQTRFFICGIIIALEYIHENNVIHRDIKPENLVLDNKGYIRLTDFGIAKENMPDNSSETSGTPGYMSPEVMKALNHSFPVDYYALGVIGYEFMNGDRPYNGKNRKEIKEQMMNNPIQLKFSDINAGWSKESIDFINKLLKQEPENRIGYNGIYELKNHLWLRYYPWDMLQNKNLPSPFIPENKDNFDKSYCESNDEITKETKLRYEEILMEESFGNAFINFYYNKDENEISNINLKKEKLPQKKSKQKIKNKYEDKIAIHKNNKSKEKNKDINDKIKNDKGKKKKIIKNSMEPVLNSARNEKYKMHKKAGSLIEYNKNINNINNISGNVSNNVIYINFNINNPNISGNSNKSYQDYSPKTDRLINSYKRSGKSFNYYKNNILKNKSLIQKIGFNIENLISPIQSFKKIKNHSLNKNNNTERTDKNKMSIFEIYNKNKKRRNIFDYQNKTSLFESSFEKNIRFSDIIAFKKNQISLTKSKNESEIKNIFDMKNETFRDSINKMRKIEMKNSLKKGTYNFLSNKTTLSNININNSPLRKLFFHNYSPYKNMNISNNILSISSINKGRLIKTYRDFGHRNFSKSNDLSVGKSRIYLNQLRSMNSNKIKSKKKNKTKNLYINFNKLFKTNKNNIDNNTSFENNKDILVDTINLKNKENQVEINKIIYNQKSIKRVNNLSKYYSQNYKNNYSMINKKYNCHKHNNLSISSFNKKNDISTNTNKSIKNNKIINIKKNNLKNKLSKEKKNFIFSYIRK